MADNKTDIERSRNMAAVKSRNTGPEMRLRKALWAAGYRYFTAHGWKKLSGQSLPGRPDIVVPRQKVVVFVDGCFWHGCPDHYTEPDDNREFWQRKLAANRLRDELVNRALTGSGWTILRLWEHELKKRSLEDTVNRVTTVLKDQLREKERVTHSAAGVVR